MNPELLTFDDLPRSFDEAAPLDIHKWLTSCPDQLINQAILSAPVTFELDADDFEEVGIVTDVAVGKTSQFDPCRVSFLKSG